MADRKKKLLQERRKYGLGQTASFWEDSKEGRAVRNLLPCPAESSLNTGEFIAIYGMLRLP